MKIAIIKLSALGDIVHASIVLQFIKSRIPEAKISWVCDKKFASLLRSHPLIDELITLPLKDKKFAISYKLLKRYHGFDIAIDLQGLIKSAIITKILCKCSAGFDSNSVKEPFAAALYSKKFKIDYNENIIIRNLSLVSKALNISFDENFILNKSPCFPAKISISNQSAKISTDGKKIILIAPFASEASKCYEKFKDVILSLQDEFSVFVSYFGAKEYVKAMHIVEKTKAKLTPAMSLAQMIDFINKTDLVIGNDSGITHLAWAQNRRSITLFGNRPSSRNAYACATNVTIDAGKKIDARKIDKTDFCVNQIAPSLIATQAKRLLNE